MLEFKQQYIVGLAFFLLATVCLESLAASQELKESFDVKEGGKLIIDSAQGSIQVNSWNKKQVQVLVEKNARNESRLDEFEVIIEQQGNSVVIEGQSGWGSRVSVKYRVNVPKKYNLELNTGGGSIEIGDLEGDAFAKTSGGSIRVGNVEGNVSVDTSGGSISVEKVTGDAKLDTSGGSIKVAAGGRNVMADTSGGSIQIGPSDGNVKADTSGGSIRIGYAQGDVSADTSGGPIVLEGSAGSASADTSGGSITIDNVAGPIVADTSGGQIKITRAQASVRADTAGGDISVALIEDNPKTDTSMKLDTAGGDITVFLPEKINATMSAKLSRSRRSQDAQIYSDFPLTIREIDERIIAEGKINDGGDVISLSTRDGDIYIKKLP